MASFIIILTFDVVTNSNNNQIANQVVFIMADNTTIKAEEQQKQTLKKAQTYLELLQAQDWDKWINLWADDAILEFPFAPKNRPSIYRGKQDILSYMSSTTRSIVVDSVAELKISPKR